jgi:hypothetical protein
MDIVGIFLWSSLMLDLDNRLYLVYAYVYEMMYVFYYYLDLDSGLFSLLCWLMLIVFSICGCASLCLCGD